MISCNFLFSPSRTSKDSTNRWFSLFNIFILSSKGFFYFPCWNVYSTQRLLLMCYLSCSRNYDRWLKSYFRSSLLTSTCRISTIRIVSTTFIQYFSPCSYQHPSMYSEKLRMRHAALLGNSSSILVASTSFTLSSDYSFFTLTLPIACLPCRLELFYHLPNHFKTNMKIFRDEGIIVSFFAERYRKIEFLSFVISWVKLIFTSEI